MKVSDAEVRDKIRGDRRCRTCSECCFALAVKELEKPDKTHCKHCKTGSWKPCSIYEDRPDACREFECLWHAGFFTSNDRPDKIGVVFAGTVIDNDEPMMIVYETREHAVSTPRVKRIIDAVTKKFALSIVPFDSKKNRRVMFPRSKKKTFDKILGKLK